MCGIVGLLAGDGRPVRGAELAAMCAALVHRGPDDAGAHIDGGLGLAMRRLSIIDLRGGHQPVHNEDRSVWVVLNGEIYNHRELRRRLEAAGHSFYTATDTEVIVHLYEERGADCVNELRGMFAFALWDARRRRLLVARDRLGIKPLYYHEAGGRLAFASELKALLQLPEVGRELDRNALEHLLAYQTTPPAASAIAGVHKLEPGHLLTAAPGEPVRVRRYWELRFEPDRGSGEAALVQGLRERLRESVRLHLISDVPLGAFLSGGIDSAAVVATMAELGAAPLKTFSIAFDDVEHDERVWARRVASALDVEHHELTLAAPAPELLEDVAWHLDEPFGDPSAIPTYMVAKLAAQQVKVVLSGDGGDELFAGYDKYRVEARERREPELPRLARAALAGLTRRLPEGTRGRAWLRHRSHAGFDRYLDANTLFATDARLRLFEPGFLPLRDAYDPAQEMHAGLGGAPGQWLSRLQYLDLQRYLPLDILTKVDRMSMAHSIEARVPLLDHELVEYAARIPPELLLRGSSGKHLFKQALRGRLPDAVIDRPKHGFSAPLAGWLRGRLRGYARELLLGERCRGRGMLRSAQVERLLALHDGGRDLHVQLWTLMSLELWCRAFLDERRRAVPQPSRAALQQMEALGAAG